MKHPIAKTFIGQHYKQWRQSDDSKEFEGNELTCYCVYNDIGDETKQKLKAWEADKFKED